MEVSSDLGDTRGRSTGINVSIELDRFDPFVGNRRSESLLPKVSNIPGAVK